ncbi:MAG: (Fe-S)-binding protein [Acidimicrobiales bacterium]
MNRSGPLGLNPDELACCVSCGLCLSTCPTFRASGEEAKSPRGRIAAMRLVSEGAPVTQSFLEVISSCVMCRACETACPSSVHFGSLMEDTRASLADKTVPPWQVLAYGVLERPKLLRVLTGIGAAAQRCRLIPRALERRLSLPRLPVRQATLTPTGSDVWLFTGCVMDAWQRPVHAATMAVLAAMGFGVSLPGPDGACCGALHSHAGLKSKATMLASKVIAAFPGDAPVLVDSAGCGAQLLDYARLLGTDEAVSFASRVHDIHEWVARRAHLLPPVKPDAIPLRVAVQDPCHLRHVQRSHLPVRDVLSRYASVVDLDDDGVCCGAGGAYSALRPKMAGAIRQAKLQVIDAAAADVVASANPGCSLWLAGGGAQVEHPMVLVAQRAGLM